MTYDDAKLAAITLGQRKAYEIFARRKVAMERRAAIFATHPDKLEFQMQVTGLVPDASVKFESTGFLVAAGDSWFDYPFHDVLKLLEDNYGYGHANTLARPSSSDLLRALQLTNPRAVTLPNAYLDRDVPRRALYAKLWEEVKAA